MLSGMECMSNVYCKNVVAPNMWFMKMWYDTCTKTNTHPEHIQKIVIDIQYCY